MAMLGRNRFPRLFGNRKEREGVDVTASTPLPGADAPADALGRRPGAPSLLQELADSGALLDRKPPPKEYPIVPERRWLLVLQGLKYFRTAFLVYVVVLVALLLAVERSETVADYRTPIHLGAVLVFLLVLVIALAGTAPREVYCPTCGHGTFAYAFPHVKPCAHCGTRTCHVRGKPANCLRCRYPMLPAEPGEMAMFGLSLIREDHSHLAYAECPHCGKGEWIRTDLEGAGHPL